jgi:hypothetical protein
MSGQNNFDPAHLYYSQALVALCNPYSSVFAEVRNSTVAALQCLKQCSAENPVQTVEGSRKTLSETKEVLKQLKGSTTAISSCRAAIEGLMHKAPSAALEQHADIFRDDKSDDSKEGGDCEQIGSDEEIIG